MKRSPSVERRKEARVPVSGAMQLRQTGAALGPFQGQLLDVSPLGFRIRHDRLALASGQLVDFEWAGRSGQARAMWTRIFGQEAETGFHIVRTDA